MVVQICRGREFFIRSLELEWENFTLDESSGRARSALPAQRRLRRGRQRGLLKFRGASPTMLGLFGPRGRMVP